MKRVLISNGLAAIAVGLSVGAGTAQEPTVALARMIDRDGTAAGKVEISAATGGVLIDVLLTGLAPGEHAIHLHETGACSGDFSAAGDHFDPHGNGHGFLSETGPHAGDLPNVFADTDGGVSAHFFNDRVTLSTSEAKLLDTDGTAVIVHALPDLYAADSGSGERVLCGVLEPFI